MEKAPYALWIRDQVLQKTDWTQGKDIQDEMTDDEKNKWRDYRGKVRKLKYIYKDGDMIEWPKPPK